MSIGRDAADRGFDELNFDYIRFPSDGDLRDTRYPHWDGTQKRHEVIRSFFDYVRSELADVRISADLFGLATINKDDLGIGQVIEDAYETFDAVAPMVYPSHYANGFLGYNNPAQKPYEIVRYSLEHAFERLMTLGIEYETIVTTTPVSALSSTTLPVLATTTITRISGFTPKATLRPWLQDFDLGATYDADKVRDQIQAVYDALDAVCPDEFYWCDELVSGYMLWNPSNVYTP